LDGDVGTPTGATYDDEDDIFTVELEVNDMVNGYEYELTVDGLEDLAGNKLVFAVEFFAIADDPENDWDDDAPELEDAEAVNEFVLALEFDEEIDYTAGVSTIELISDNGDFDETDTLLLTARADKDDATVIEFSGTGADFFEDGVTYTVYRAADLFDLMGLEYVVDQDANDLVTFRGTDEIVEFVEVDKIEQVNGGQFDVTMSGFVDYLPGTDEDTVIDEIFNATIDDDVITFTTIAGEAIEKDVIYEINFSDLFMDLHGFAVVDDDDEVDPVTYAITDGDNTELEGEETDDDVPYIEDVVALDRWTIEIEFSEDIEAIALGDFEIMNVDLDEEVDIDTAVFVFDDDVDGNVVTFTLEDALEGRYEYELTMDEDAVLDYAELGAEADTFVFDGSDLASH
jgi:hypothetical protein